MTDPAPVEAADLDEVLTFIAAEQAHPDRGTTMLGEERDGIAAELDDLEPDWRTSLRAVREDGRLVAAVVGDWDAELGRAWIHGPWVADGDADLWARWSRPLVESVLAQLPDGIEDWELAADASHVLMASLGADLGLAPSEANHVYTVDAATVAGWRAPAGEVRTATSADRETIRPLHDQEFPATYAPVETLLPDEPDGKYVVAVAFDGDTFLGYAAGRVQPDGEGYLDFIAVSDEARGRGTGRALMAAVCRPVLDASTTGKVHLTVQDHREPARAMYEALGFERSLAIVGYRCRPPS
jgi:ribosomal protein S18 acetylase RimI-like enzyme